MNNESAGADIGPLSIVGVQLLDGRPAVRLHRGAGTSGPADSVVRQFVCLQAATDASAYGLDVVVPLSGVRQTMFLSSTEVFSATKAFAASASDTVGGRLFTEPHTLPEAISRLEAMGQSAAAEDVETLAAYVLDFDTAFKQLARDKELFKLLPLYRERALAALEDYKRYQGIANLLALATGAQDTNSLFIGLELAEAKAIIKTLGSAADKRMAAVVAQSIAMAAVPVEHRLECLSSVDELLSGLGLL